MSNVIKWNNAREDNDSYVALQLLLKYLNADFDLDNFANTVDNVIGKTITSDIFGNSILTFDNGDVSTGDGSTASLDNRTATVIVPATGDKVVDGTMVAGDDVTTRPSRGVRIFEDGKEIGLSWTWTDTVEITIESDGEEHSVEVLFEL